MELANGKSRPALEEEVPAGLEEVVVVPEELMSRTPELFVFLDDEEGILCCTIGCLIVI